MQKTIVLAFDIERSGATDFYDTIAIGASVLNEKMEELGSLLVKGYSEKVTRFEKRCWDEFWSKNREILKKLKRNNIDNTYILNQKDMIEEFQKFRKYWEKYAFENSAKYYLLSDNKVFDGGFINEMIFKYLPGEMPLPYSAWDNRYSTFFETHSMMRGFLMRDDPNFHSDWGFFDRIRELYEFPAPVKKHDHLPNHDAYTIAYEFLILRGISAGIYPKRS